MATGVVYQRRRDELNQLVRGWDRRRRLQQMMGWLPRSLMPGLAAGIVMAVVSRVQPWLLGGQILLITGILMVVGAVVMALVVGLWPRPGLKSAQEFDLLFGLQERVSTALELIDGRIHGDNRFLVRQVDDAWQRAHSVRPSEVMPLPWDWREWSGVLALTAALALLLVIPNPQETILNQNAAQDAAIESAAEDLQEITDTVQADTTLEPQDQQELLQVLKSSAAVLDQPNVTSEEAFAALTDAQGALESKSDELNQQSAAKQASLQAATSAVQNLNPPQDQQATNPEATPETPSDAGSTLEDLASKLPEMTEVQKQDMAESLAQTAQQLQTTSPSVAQALNQASQSLAQGDVRGAQDALQQASGDLQDAAQSADSQAQSAEQLSQSAQAMQASANQIGQQSSGNQSGQPQPDAQSGQEGQQGNQQPAGANDSSGGESAQPQDQQGRSGQTSQSGQPSSAGQTGQSDQPGQQGGGQGQAANPGSSQGQGAQGSNTEGGTVGAESNAVGSGAGDSAGGAGSESGGVQGGQVPQDNNPDGQGEGQYDPVYAPQRIGGQSGSDQNIVLDPDASDAPVQQGEFAQNPAGSASVPYNQVYNDYSDAANRALESDYIPLGMRDVVRDYFSSLEPGQNNGNNNNGGSNP